jgi:F420-dependent oxidoreductase-like protein
LEIAIIIEGQNGLNWPRWQRIAKAVEELGFFGLYRSDHYTNHAPPDLDSLELWVSLTWLASHTSRIEFGPLVSPISFRHPTMTARMAAAVDDLSGGRLHLGLGAGWQEREHHNYGWQLLAMPERMHRFSEGVEIISRLFRSPEPLNFDGRYYQLHDAVLLPRPQRPKGPPLIIGGVGRQYTLPLAARSADEWNGLFLTPAGFTDLNHQLDELLTAQGRRPDEVRRSLMTGLFFGKDEAALQKSLAQRRQSAGELRRNGRIVGLPGQVVEQLGRLAEAGVQRIILQWFDLDDLEGLESLAQAVLAR